MLRIAILSQYPLDLSNTQGGVESSTVGLIKELKKFDDLDLHIITSTKQVNANKTIVSTGFTVHYVSSSRLPRLVTSLTFDQCRLKRKIREIKPDLIHAHMTAPLYGYPALKSGYPAIITVHGIVSEESKTWQGVSGRIKRVLFLVMENYVFKNAKTLTVVSPYVKNEIRKRCDSNIHVIPNGVHEDFFELKNNEIENRLLFVGGLEPRKGLLNLLKAVNIVKDEIPQLKLHIVGRVRKKTYFKSLREYIGKNDLSKYVIFKGSLTEDELKKEFSECTVFTFPSQEESQGIVLLEAMAVRKPVIATNIGGIPYIVDNGKTGLLVEYGDVAGLARGILKLLKNKKLREEYGKKGREKAKSFSNVEIAKRYYELYKTVIS